VIKVRLYCIVLQYATSGIVNSVLLSVQYIVKDISLSSNNGLYLKDKVPGDTIHERKSIDANFLDSIQNCLSAASYVFSSKPDYRKGFWSRSH